MKKFINLKALTLAIFLSLAFTFFIGSFNNSPKNMDASFAGPYWYYINRGYPNAWTGVALKGSQVSFPHIVVPFLHEKDNRGNDFTKIIDLKIFLPFFMAPLLVFYLFSFILVKATDENKKIMPFYVVLQIMGILAFLFTYFLLFLRI